MEQARWKDKVIAEEYAREVARAQYQTDNAPPKKSSRFRHLENALIGTAAFGVIYLFGEIIGFSKQTFFSGEALIPFAAVTALFLYLWKS